MIKAAPAAMPYWASVQLVPWLITDHMVTMTTIVPNVVVKRCLVVRFATKRAAFIMRFFMSGIFEDRPAGRIYRAS